MSGFPLGKMFGVLFLGFIAYRIVLFGNAEFIYRLSPESVNSAVTSNSSQYFQSNVYYSLAKKALKQKKYPLAELLILQSLKADNSNGRAMTLAIGIYEKLENKKSQSLAVDLTNSLWHSHLFAHATLAEYWAKNRNYVNLLAEWNILLLQDKSFENSLFPLLQSYLEDAHTREYLLPYWSSPPAWWNRFFSFVSKDSLNEKNVNWLYQKRKASAAPLMQVEYRSYIKRLVVDNQWQQAFKIWNEQIKADNKRYESFVYDGGFESVDTKSKRVSIFDWKILPHKWIKFDSRLAFGANKKALKIEFIKHQGKIKFKHLSQVLMLPEKTHYKLSFKVRTGGMKVQSNLLWRVYCQGKNRASIGESAPIERSPKWQMLSFNFQVPAQNCQRQLLRLESKSQHKDMLEGRYWFDDVKIEKGEIL